ncbi:GGDEF domain-containing protein [Shewanella indica]|uniref:GGDEF domain-containing protein n=1 Tax=Shewanella indica TaxID=768528 RepID=UPI003999DFFA
MQTSQPTTASKEIRLASDRAQNIICNFIAIGRSLALISIFMGSLVLLGYVIGLEILYRPLVDGPATHPLTAIAMICIASAALIYQFNAFRELNNLFTIIAMIISGLVIVDALFGTELAVKITPFIDKVRTDLLAGKSNGIGTNTAAMALLLSFAQLFANFRLPTVSQVFAFLAAAFPVVSITGYAYGLDRFYGSMSFYTTTFGICLAVSLLSLTAKYSTMRVLLSPYPSGRVARIQLLLGYSIPFSIGYLFLQTIIESHSHDVFGAFVVTVGWSIIILSMFSAIYLDRSDMRRRHAEQALVLAATHDELTGLPNRRQFIEDGNRELHRLKRTDDELSLIMIDIDYFKKINDTAGHQMGDKVLVAVADILRQSIRETDFISRIGGEEFTLLLTNSNVRTAVQFAEKLRKRIEDLSIPGWTDKFGPVTVSMGVAQTSGIESLDQLVSRTDSLLYQAKNAGRNSVVSG